MQKINFKFSSLKNFGHHLKILRPVQFQYKLFEHFYITKLKCKIFSFYSTSEYMY